MTKESHIKAVIKAIEDHKQAGTDIDVRLLLSVDRKRSLDDAYDTVRIAKQYLSYSSHIVLGVDFSGDPKVYSSKVLKYVTSITITIKAYLLAI